MRRGLTRNGSIPWQGGGPEPGDKDSHTPPHGLVIDWSAAAQLPSIDWSAAAVYAGQSVFSYLWGGLSAVVRSATRRTDKGIMGLGFGDIKWLEGYFLVGYIVVA
eukprot:9091991-Pyramimonas_sp.AAC.1